MYQAWGAFGGSRGIVVRLGRQERTGYCDVADGRWGATKGLGGRVLWAGLTEVIRGRWLSSMPVVNALGMTGMAWCFGNGE